MGERTRSPARARADAIGTLRLWLLGGFRVAVGSQVIDEEGWRLRKAKGLVKALALAPGHRLLREHLVDLLWPDSDPESASSNFHRALYVARRALVPSGEKTSAYLHLQSDMLSLCPQEPCWIDVEAFETAAAVARARRDPEAYQQALDLYQGDLLPEDRYEDWCRPRREALRREHVDLLAELAELYEAKHQYGAAISALQRLLAQDAAHEETHRALMRLHALAGHRQQALRQYQALQEAQRREFATAPDHQSQQLYQVILDGRFPPTGSTPETEVQAESRHTSFSLRAAAPADGEEQLAGKALPNNLLIQLTSFVGRQREMAELKGLLATTRLLTLTGVGGCGKTRLALEVASGLLSTYADGVWLVELAGLLDPKLVPHAVASVLSVPEQSGGPLVETIAAYLRPRHTLLVLDNCEHLIAACAHPVETLLRTCPDLRVLATSREPLHISGELTWRVPSLSLPDPGRLPPLEELLESEAVRLFLDRAAAALPGYALSPQNAAAVAQICYRLDGIPLAIELAAPRVRVLSADQIVARLDDCFALLTGGSRTTMTRQQTLKATLDWSYLLLPEREQLLLQRLAVFAGGLSLEAAERVCAGDAIGSPDVLGLLVQLVDKSLVVAEEQGGVARYRLLETIRLYARDELYASGQAELAHTRHVDWYLGLVEQAETELWGPGQMTWLNQLETEHDNLRVALGWCLRHDPQAGLRLAGALWQFWLLRGYFSEGRQWLGSALARAPERAALRPRALLGACALAVRCGEVPEAIRLLEESLAIARALDDQLMCAHTLHNLGSVVGVRADYVKARTLLSESLTLVQAAESPPGFASVMHSMGILAWYEGDFVQARAHLEASVALFRESVDEPGVSFPLLNLGWVAMPPRPAPQPRMALWEETFMLFRQVRARSAIGYTLANLGNLARLDGDYLRARARLEESLALFRASGDRVGLGQVLGQLGNLATSEGNYEHARELLEKSLALRRELGERRSIAVTLGNLGNLAVCAGDYARAHAVMEESLALVREMGDRPGIAGILSNLGNLATCEGEYVRARALFGESLRWYQEAGLPREVGLILVNLGTAARLQGDLTAAGEYLERGVAEFRAVGLRRGLAIALHALGQVVRDAAGAAQARPLLAEGLSLYQELRDERAVAVLREELEHLAPEAGVPAGASPASPGNGPG